MTTDALVILLKVVKQSDQTPGSAFYLHSQNHKVLHAVIHLYSSIWWRNKVDAMVKLYYIPVRNKTDRRPSTLYGATTFPSKQILYIMNKVEMRKQENAHLGGLFLMKSFNCAREGLKMLSLADRASWSETDPPIALHLSPEEREED